MRQLKTYAKRDIATRLLETALKLYFNGGDGFAVIHLAAASEELLSGMIKEQRESGVDLPALASERTAREKSIRAIGGIREVHGSPKKTEKEIGDYLNRVRNETKHYGSTDNEEILVILEFEIEETLHRSIDNFVHYFKAPTESMLRFIKEYASAARDRTLPVREEADS
ncbi:MAG: hypothetical protein ACREC0_00780 [Methylocella sp.]